MNIDTLRIELLAGHPDTGAYSLNNRTAMDQINVINRSRNRISMTGTEVLQAIDNTEFDALTDDQRHRVFDVLHMQDGIDPFGVEVSMFISIFGGGSTTIGTLATLRVETVSRSVELGLGTTKLGHVEMARI